MAEEENPTPPSGDSATKLSEDGTPLPVRRSSRVRKRPSIHDEETEPQDKPRAPSPSAPAARRNPKRKAAPETFNVPDDLLEASLGPWKENEQAEWPSWTELESDPDFFTWILGLLGVKGAKIEEVLSVDEVTLATLPQPVYGLVFLYEYISEDGPTAAETGDGLWFANQTTNNACATIALLNIIMNAEGLALGEKLRTFKQDSIDLSPPLRGNMITNSEWIRTAHNSFARRLDLLNAALALQNDVDKKNKRAKASTSKGKTSKSKSGKSAVDVDYSYHFIAYVPVGQEVWQLDGLKSGPVCIGAYAADQHWTSVMRIVLEERMMRYETERLSFSLLALCGDKLSQIRRRLAATILSLADLETIHGDKPDWVSAVSALPERVTTAGDPKDDAICSTDDERLCVYELLGIEQMNLNGVYEPPGSGSGVAFGESVEEAVKKWERYWNEQSRIRDEYREELERCQQEKGVIIGRTKDNTAAIHEWVKKLVDHGVLRKLHEEVQLRSGM